MDESRMYDLQCSRCYRGTNRKYHKPFTLCECGGQWMVRAPFASALVVTRCPHNGVAISEQHYRVNAPGIAHVRSPEEARRLMDALREHFPELLPANVAQARREVISRMAGCPEPNCSACRSNRDSVEGLIGAVQAAAAAS